MIERITANRSGISPDELLDACLYEMGCLHLRESTSRILLEELEVKGNLNCGSEEFRETIAQMLRLIVASREYQFA